MGRVVAWIVLAAYVALAAGLPLPAGAIAATGRHGIAAATRVAKDRSHPFPCMDSPCGCASAEQCFRACCCHSPAERLAWARRHGVEADVLAALGRQGEAKGPRSVGKTSSSCCDDDRVTLCQESGADASGPASCCGRTPPTEAPPRPRGVTLRALLACQGIVAQWIAVGGTLPPVRVEVGALVPPCGVVELFDATSSSPSWTPVVPPPEAA